MLSVYIAHPVSGMTFEEAFNFFSKMNKTISDMGFKVFDPVSIYSNKMENKTAICRPHGIDSNIICDHALFERCKWMVDKSDIIFMDLTGSIKISIGCIMELAWASKNGCHTIVCVEEESVYQHAFVKESADVIFDRVEMALEYLKSIK